MRTTVHTDVNPRLAAFPAFQEIAASVVFGTPSKRCAGNGICIITKPDAVSRLSISCQIFLALISFLSDGRLCVRIPKSGLQVAPPPHLQTGFLLVEEPFTIPRWLLRAWGKPRIRIPPGRYAVRETPEAWIVLF
jgi:hypothetical protein